MYMHWDTWTCTETHGHELSTWTCAEHIDIQFLVYVFLNFESLFLVYLVNFSSIDRTSACRESSTLSGLIGSLFRVNLSSHLLFESHSFRVVLFLRLTYRYLSSEVLATGEGDIVRISRHRVGNPRTDPITNPDF
jgi:hypothetical protein